MLVSFELFRARKTEKATQIDSFRLSICTHRCCLLVTTMRSGFRLPSGLKFKIGSSNKSVSALPYSVAAATAEGKLPRTNFHSR